jgi:maltose O-acetyltransferase
MKRKKLYIYWRDFYLNFVSSSILLPNFIRYFLYKLYGIKIYSKKISPKCFIGNNNLYIGRNTFINYGCYFNTEGGIKIGNYCDIAYQVTFCTSSHEVGSISRRAGKNTAKPIEVKDGTWIGARSIILPGVTIGESCIIAAGTVVTKDCKSNGLYAGVPAKRIKDLN